MGTLKPLRRFDSTLFFKWFHKKLGTRKSGMRYFQEPEDMLNILSPTLSVWPLSGNTTIIVKNRLENVI